MSELAVDRQATVQSHSPAIWNALALALSCVASIGSVYLSIGLGLKACPLCFYQRTFAIGTALVLTTLLCLDGARSPRACLTALSLAIGGLGVAAFHVYLVQTEKLECPAAMFGWGDGPLQSLIVFTALTGVCLVGSCRCAIGRRLPTAIAALLLGVVAAWACIASAPAMPPTPTQPYDKAKPFDMCRPPYRPESQS